MRADTSCSERNHRLLAVALDQARRPVRPLGRLLLFLVFLVGLDCRDGVLVPGVERGYLCRATLRALRLVADPANRPGALPLAAVQTEEDHPVVLDALPDGFDDTRVGILGGQQLPAGGPAAGPDRSVFADHLDRERSRLDPPEDVGGPTDVQFLVADLSDGLVVDRRVLQGLQEPGFPEGPPRGAPPLQRTELRCHLGELEFQRIRVFQREGDHPRDVVGVGRLQQLDDVRRRDAARNLQFYPVGVDLHRDARTGPLTE